MPLLDVPVSKRIRVFGLNVYWHKDVCLDFYVTSQFFAGVMYVMMQFYKRSFNLFEIDPPIFGNGITTIKSRKRAYVDILETFCPLPLTLILVFSI